MTEEIFISHDTIEAAAATALKASLERLGHTVFVASEDIKLGEAWEERIKRRLQSATTCIVLCSVRSVRSQWVLSCPRLD
jgi:hypothetical protein